MPDARLFACIPFAIAIGCLLADAIGGQFGLFTGVMVSLIMLVRIKNTYFDHPLKTDVEHILDQYEDQLQLQARANLAYVTAYLVATLVCVSFPAATREMSAVIAFYAVFIALIVQINRDL